MTVNQISCCILGGREADLFVLGEIQKRPDVTVAFVYDPDPTAVGLEIAEILGIRPLSTLNADAVPDSLDYVVVSEPRERFDAELELLDAMGAKILTQAEALRALCGAEPPPQPPPVADGAPYSIEDALAAFERLFDRKQLLRFLLDVAVEAAGADSGSIMMYSEESGELYIDYATGLSDRVVRSTRQKIGEGIAGMVAQDRRGKLIRDPGEGALYPSDRDRGPLHSAISVPLEWNGKLIGVLNVSSQGAEHPLTREGLSKLERLSTRISRLLYESSKLEEARVRREEMDLRQSMGRLTETSMSTQGRFCMISNLLGDLVSADTVEIFVGTHEGDWLVLGGSNRRVSSTPDMIRCDKGAVSRAYLDRRTVVLTEASSGDEGALASSFVFVPLQLTETLGVLMLEFAERSSLEAFLVIKDSVALELSRFIGSEKRERRLRRELNALGKVSDSAPTLLTCRSVDELCEFLSRLVADALECERVSVRLQPNDKDRGRIARYEGGATRMETWAEEDEERFLSLKTKQEAYTLAFLDFHVENPDATPAYHSLLAVPVSIDDRFAGGIIAYDRQPANALEEATFSDLDASIVEHITAIAVPVLRALTRGASVESIDEPSYDTILSGNLQRFKKILETEMSRADRYHNGFSLLQIRIPRLGELFDDDYKAGLLLVDEVTRGIQTRTRKTDFGSWIRRDTFSMLSLEGSKRVKFLVSRLVLYLLKDCTAAGLSALEPSDVLVGRVVYPGAARTPEALLSAADAAMSPFGDD